MNSEEIKKQKQSENSRKYYQKNKDKILKKQKEYVRKKYNEDEEYRKRQLKRHKEYAEKYPEKVREIKRKAQLNYMNKKRVEGLLPLTKAMQIEILQQRIDKAIKFIETFKNDIRGIDEIVLLKILKGENE